MPPVVCDASALVALLLDSGSDGQWAAQQLSGAGLAAPTLLSFETANVIRRHESAGLVSSDQSAQAHADLLDLDIEHWPYAVLGRRAWQLRFTVSSFDASYVALAELLGTTLITLDRRLSTASGPRCAIVTPPSGTSG